MLPPFYPHAAPGDGGFIGAAQRALAAEGVETLPWYPFITDASLVAGDAAERATAERWTPSVAHAALPPAPLGAGVVNLGPWGRDAHGLGERVDTDWAFGRLPGLIERILRLP
jgi:arginine utilization protein RocB